MRFLIDASLPRGVAGVVVQFGYEVIDVRDVGLRTAPDQEIAAYAQAHRLAILSADFDFADIRHYRPSEYDGLVVFDRPEDAKVVDVLRLVESLFQWTDLPADLAGKLIVVDWRRIRMRGD